MKKLICPLVHITLLQSKKIKSAPSTSRSNFKNIKILENIKNFQRKLKSPNLPTSNAKSQFTTRSVFALPSQSHGAGRSSKFNSSKWEEWLH